MGGGVGRGDRARVQWMALTWPTLQRLVRRQVREPAARDTREVAHQRRTITREASGLPPPVGTVRLEACMTVGEAQARSHRGNTKSAEAGPWPLGCPAGQRQARIWRNVKPRGAIPHVLSGRPRQWRPREQGS